MGAKCPERISRSGHLLFALHSAKHQLAVFRIDGNCRTGLDAALQNLLCKQRFHCMLHIPAQRTRAELRIVGRVDDELFCSLRQLTTQLLVGQTAVERRDLQVDDTGDVLFRQRPIKNIIVSGETGYTTKVRQFCKNRREKEPSGSFSLISFYGMQCASCAVSFRPPCSSG